VGLAIHNKENKPGPPFQASSNPERRRLRYATLSMASLRSGGSVVKFEFTERRLH